MVLVFLCLTSLTIIVSTSFLVAGHGMGMLSPFLWLSNITKIMASGPITLWEIDGETVETVSDFFGGAPKSLQMVTAAKKLKDAYSLEGKL